MNKFKILAASIILWGTFIQTSTALTFAINPNSDIIGSVQTATVLEDESFDTIGRKFDVGIYELIEANHRVDPREPSEGATLVVPTQYILPSGPRIGIVINLAEMRIYYFHKDHATVSTYPIGIGRKDWETPIANGKITEKNKDPYWRPPSSIRAWYDEHHKYLPDIVPPGPQNPLGQYALRLSIPGYMIHGTNMPSGIGIRSSSGCIRMFPEDIESLFHQVSLGDQVRIVNQPYKIGRHWGRLYIESHDPLSGEVYNTHSDGDMLEEAIETVAAPGVINQKIAKSAAERSHGYPTLIQ